MDNCTLALIAEYTRRYAPMSTEERGIRRIISLQTAQDRAAWDLRDTQNELASTANPCVWDAMLKRYCAIDEAVFWERGGYDYFTRSPERTVPDPFYEQAQRNAAGRR